jgi:hypothetical protein
MASPSATAQRSWLRRIVWLVLIWTASVLALGMVAALLRALMNLLGTV